jgi:hypothetical protein
MKNISGRGYRREPEVVGLVPQILWDERSHHLGEIFSKGKCSK